MDTRPTAKTTFNWETTVGWRSGGYLNLRGRYNAKMVSWACKEGSILRSQTGRALVSAGSYLWGHTLGTILAPERIGIIKKALDVSSYDAYVRNHLENSISAADALNTDESELLRRTLLANAILRGSKNKEGFPWRQEGIIHLQKIQLGGKYLSGLRFVKIDFSGASFSGAVLTESSFHYTNLYGARFQDALTTSTLFYNSDVAYANFKGAGPITESTFDESNKNITQIYPGALGQAIKAGIRGTIIS